MKCVTSAYHHITESIHTLNDMNNDDMALGQHFEDGHDYGLEAPSQHSLYLDGGSEFYPSTNLLQESKYQPQYATNKAFNNRGPNRLFGNYMMISACGRDELLIGMCFVCFVYSIIHWWVTRHFSHIILTCFPNQTGRYTTHDINSIVDNYPSHHYEQSFQTVPSSVPPTPSPEQWPNELSPHSNSGTPNGLTGTALQPHHQTQHPPPPAHHGQQAHHMSHHAHQTYTPLHHPRDHSGLNHLTQLHSPNATHQSLLTSQTIDGKPVIQAAVLAGNHAIHAIL
jgi:hypothetical protein